MIRRAFACGIAAAAPSAALAADWETGVSGFFNLGMAYADRAGADGDVGIFRDGEFHVNARLTADNGLVFRARIEIEAHTTGETRNESNTPGDQIDENWASVSGPFGTLVIGGADTALNEHGGVGVVYPTGDYINYYDASVRAVPGAPGAFMGKDDSLGIRYFHTIGGLTAGASWQPRVGADNAADSNDPVFGGDDQFALGASYRGEVSGLGFALGGGWLQNDGERQHHLGVELSAGGYTVAGFYNREDPDGASPDDFARYGIGAMGVSGPWTYGGGYTLTDGMNGTGNAQLLHVGASYALAPGVTARAAVQYGEDDADVDGVGGFAWLNLRF